MIDIKTAIVILEERIACDTQLITNDKSDFNDFLISRHEVDKLAIQALQEKVDREKVRTLDEWNEDDDTVLWWKFPIQEPPYCGSPLDCDFPNWVTHWTILLVPEEKQ